LKLSAFSRFQYVIFCTFPVSSLPPAHGMVLPLHPSRTCRVSDSWSGIPYFPGRFWSGLPFSGAAPDHLFLTDGVASRFPQRPPMLLGYSRSSHAFAFRLFFRFRLFVFVLHPRSRSEEFSVQYVDPQRLAPPPPPPLLIDAGYYPLFRSPLLLSIFFNHPVCFFVARGL